MHPFNRFLRILLLAVLAFGMVLPAGSCPAEIYRWQDEQGYWHFSDSPTPEAPVQQPPAPAWEDPGANTPPAPSHVDTPAAPAAANASTEAAAVQGDMLWRVSRGGPAPSYLLGTIHSADPRAVRLKPAVRRALESCERFVMEMDSAALLALSTGMMMTDGKDLEAVLGRNLYERVVAALSDYGFPEMVVGKMKPWVAMALLSMPKPSVAPVLDMVLYQRARAGGKPTAGLETAQEQLAVFEGLSMADQIALLKMTVDQLPALPGLFDQLIRAYAADDLQRVAELASGYAHQGGTAAVKRFVLRLNDDRNRRMAVRMIPYLQQGNSFIAVGALHLAGPAGLIDLLRARGYDVAPVR